MRPRWSQVGHKKGPKFINEAEGSAIIETYTVINDREGPSYAIIFGRLANGNRFIANMPKDIDLLIDMMKNEYLNLKGYVNNNNGKGTKVRGQNSQIVGTIKNYILPPDEGVDDITLFVKYNESGINSISKITIQRIRAEEPKYNI